MRRKASLATQIRVQALLVAAGAVMGAAYPLVGPGKGVATALPVHLGGAVACAAVLLFLSGLLAVMYPHHPTPGFWYTMAGLQLGAAVGLVFFTGGADSPSYYLLLLICALTGLQHAAWSGVAAGSLAAVVLFLVFLLGEGSQEGTLGVIMRALALPAFGGFGYLAALSGSSLDAGHVEDHGRRLEEAYATARQQAREREKREHDLYDKQRKLTALMQVSRHLSTVRSPEELMTMIVRSAREEMNSGLAMVLLIRGNELAVAQSHGLSQPSSQALSTKVGTGLFGEMVVSGQVRRLAERDGTEWRDGLVGVRERIRTLLAVPLQTPQDRAPFGVLAVANILVGDCYDRDHEDYLKILATDAAISIKNISLFNELERSYYEIIQALAQAIEAKDPYTHGHVGRVRTYATRLARAMAMPEEEIELIAKAAILHDVGKLAIPDHILMKTGSLTEEEFGVMKAHPENALLVLKDIRSLPPRVIDMVLHHHERYDGRGYPHGLKGDEIPLGAQVLSVADTFDAMTSDRPYRKGFTPEEALVRMEAAMGTQFNPKILSVFFTLFDYRPRGPALEIETSREGR